MMILHPPLTVKFCDGKLKLTCPTKPFVCEAPSGSDKKHRISIGVRETSAAWVRTREARNTIHKTLFTDGCFCNGEGERRGFFSV